MECNAIMTNYFIQIYLSPTNIFYNQIIRTYSTFYIAQVAKNKPFKIVRPDFGVVYLLQMHE